MKKTFFISIGFALLSCIVVSCKKKKSETTPAVICNVSKTFEIALIDYNNASYLPYTFSTNVTAKFLYTCCSSAGSSCAPPSVLGNYTLTTMNTPLSSTSVTTSPCYYGFATNSVTVDIPIGSTYSVEIYNNSVKIATFTGTESGISAVQWNDANTLAGTCLMCCSKPYMIYVAR